MNAFPSDIPLPEHLRAPFITKWDLVTSSEVIKPLLDKQILHVLAQVMVSSPFVTEHLLKHPAWLSNMLVSADLLTQYLPQEMQQRVRHVVREVSTIDDLMKRLRAVRQREMLRIAWRDISGWGSGEQTLLDLSNLADACITEATHILSQWLTFEYGAPRSEQGEIQSFIVIGMGKLGAYELNFSSDVDLIFAYPKAGMTDGKKSIPNEAYFSRLGQQLIKVLDVQTEDGFVFRVDMRLRPYGESAPIVINFVSMENYYHGVAREWERYAMVKARIIVGTQSSRKQFEEIIRPFVYRRYLDYSATDSLRKMKAQIITETQRKGLLTSVKLGPGGIREVEFVGQVFQLISGGRESILQIRSIVSVLNVLKQMASLSAETVDALVSAYWFLRRTENHIQMMTDQQIHCLPADPDNLWRLAYSLGFERVDNFVEVLDHHRTQVQSCFQDIFSGQPPQAVDEWYALWFDDEINGNADWGYFSFPALQKQLSAFKATRAYRVMTLSGRSHLDRLMPKLLSSLADKNQAQALLPRFLSFLEQITGRVPYLAIIAEYDIVRSQLVKLGVLSRWIMDLLTRFPLLLEELLDHRELFEPPNRERLENEMKILLSKVDKNDLEQQMEAVRCFVHKNKLRIAAADITDAYPLMAVCNQLSMVAEISLKAVTNLSWQSLVARYGEPVFKDNGQWHNAQFGILAYGKLAGSELSYSSDLDIVFVFDGKGDRQKTNGEESVENQWFFVRLAQKIIHFLQTTLDSGAAYEIDTRLRPNGNSGLLVSHLDRFSQYQEEEAWTWEHQALVRARMVVGDGSLVQTFKNIRRSVLSQTRDIKQLGLDVSSMRESMRQQLGHQDPTRFHLKQDAGGIADIEFIVQYCVLRFAHGYPELLAFTDNIRLLAIIPKTGILTVKQAQRLAEAFRTYRSVVNLHTLNFEPAQTPIKTFATLQADVVSIWRQIFESE